VASLGLVLPITPVPLAVLIALVRCHVDHDPNVAGHAHRVEQVDRAHDVDVVRGPRVLERGTHERLGGHVDDDLGSVASDGGAQRVEIAHVAVDVLHARSHPGNRVERLLVRGAVGEPDEVGPKALQPDREPGPLEARVAG
jgi:hypothetical protein